MRPAKVLQLLTFNSLLLLAVFLINAADNGSISGKLTNGKTGLPIVGATVMIIGTNFGAVTDINGTYTIENVPPGEYTLRFSALGFKTLELSEVTVSSSVKEIIDLKLDIAKTELDKIVTVRARRDMIDKSNTASSVTIGKDETEKQNTVKGVAHVATTKKSKDLVRGARSGEISYLQDNMSKVPQADEYVVTIKKMPPKIKTQIEPNQSKQQKYHRRHNLQNAIVNNEPYRDMFFKNYGVNPFVDTEDDFHSTFAIDTDDASFIMTRSYLNRGFLPPQDAVRTEEFINHFNYNYLSNTNNTFNIYLEGAPSRFGDNSQLLKIGIKARVVHPDNRKAANLVFVIDVSGSMNTENRLEMVKYSLKCLVNELKPNDKVGIVVYGSRGRVLLKPTYVRDKHRILEIIEFLTAGGSTYAEEGIRLGYKMASSYFDSDRVNRVILCSDGVANVGRTGADDILNIIDRYVKQGITLSTVGFGMGNYNDILLEKLGNKGNGSYSYVDNLSEARRVFINNLTGNLQLAARDVKIQVEFDPKVVRSYRLLGYENRDVLDKDFRNDKKDGGEIGAGHQVTALYEIKFHPNQKKQNLGTVFIRYKDPDCMEVVEINRVIKRKFFKNSFQAASLDFQLSACAAEFAEILRGSYWAKESNLHEVKKLAMDIYHINNDDDILELTNLISQAEILMSQRAER